jgi:hypothetical protein
MGTDKMMRPEYIQYGKGREVSLLNATIFEFQLARGAALLMKAPDLYGLLDCSSGFSLVFGSAGHSFSTLLFDVTISSFCWIILLMSISHVNEEQIGILGSLDSIPC